MGDGNDYGTLQTPDPAYSGNQHPGSAYTGSSAPGKAVVIKSKAVVGEKLVLDASILFPMWPVTKVIWDLPSGAIKKYYNTLYFGKVIPIAPADKTKTKLEFFFAESGPKIIQASVIHNFNGYAVPINYQLNFDVDGPKLVRLDAKTSKVTLRQEGKDWFLEFKDKKIPGIMWDWEVLMPASNNGYVKDLQTLAPGGRKKVQRISLGSRETRSLVRDSIKGKENILDDNPVEGKEGREPTYDLAMFSFPQLLYAGKPESNAGIHDSPASTLTPLDQHYIVNESFKYFLLFKPDKPGAIWVPVAKAEWFWQAEAVRNKYGWKMKSSSGGLRKKGETTTEFPLYDGNANDHQWIEAK